MRIALLSDGIPPESSGGAETIAWALARGLSGLGHEVHVVAATRGKPFEETREGIATYHLHSATRARFQQYATVFNPQTIGPLNALLRRIQPDLVNAHNVHNDLSYWSLVSAHRMGIPVVWNAHDLTAISFSRVRQSRGAEAGSERLPPFHDLRQARLRWNPLRKPFIRAILHGAATARVSVSQAQANALMANGIPGMQVVHNGIDTDRFTQAPAETIDRLRARLGLAGRRVILFAGRLRREKGAVQLVEAMDRLVRRVGDASLLVLADRGYKRKGRMREKFPEVFEKHIVESGWLQGDELAAAYQLADVVAVPSIYLDPFPTVNLEAMAAGRPVVATCFGGSPEAIADGETGYIVNPFDTDQFAGRLEALLVDEALRRAMGSAGQRRAREMFSLERYVSAMLEVYRAAAG